MDNGMIGYNRDSVSETDHIIVPPMEKNLGKIIELHIDTYGYFRYRRWMYSKLED